MTNIFNPKKQPKSQPPSWLRWGILGFALLAGLNAYFAQISEEPSELKVENYPEVDDLVSAHRWQRIMNPHYDAPSEETPEKATLPSEEVASETSHFDAPTTEPVKEPKENEPDSEPTASNQTIPNDGGDSESR